MFFTFRHNPETRNESNGLYNLCQISIKKCSMLNTFQIPASPVKPSINQSIILLIFQSFFGKYRHSQYIFCGKDGEKPLPHQLATIPTGSRQERLKKVIYRRHRQPCGDKNLLVSSIAICSITFQLVQKIFFIELVHQPVHADDIVKVAFPRRIH